MSYFILKLTVFAVSLSSREHFSVIVVVLSLWFIRSHDDTPCADFLISAKISNYVEQKKLSFHLLKSQICPSGVGWWRPQTELIVDLLIGWKDTQLQTNADIALYPLQGCWVCKKDLKLLVDDIVDF